MRNPLLLKTSKQNVCLFLAGFLTGICCFLITYGTRVLDITNTAWIFVQESPDIRQHYLGFCHFLRSPWSFPLGMIDSLSYPWKMSIVWTDSIPAACIFFKLIRHAVPMNSQYFGWLGLISFALTGGIAALLMKRLTRSLFISAISVPFFVLSFPMLQRMFYHTSLTSQWILLLAFLLWFSRDFSSEHLTGRCLTWGIMGFICVMFHPYFLPMVGLVILAEAFEYLIRNGQYKASAACIISFCFTAVLTLWALGAFESKVADHDYSIGGFNANLNTFFNSCGKGLIPALPLKYDTQLEGYGYIGLGMMILVMTVILLSVRARYFKKNSTHSIIESHPRASASVLLFVIFCIISFFPEADLGNITVIPDLVPQAVKIALGTFRSNGRFIWGAMYIIMFSSITLCSRLLSRRSAIVLLIICLVLQLADLSPYIADRHELFTRESSYGCVLDSPEINAVTDNYEHIVLTFDNNDLIMNCAYYAYLHGKTLNRFYFARNIDNKTSEQLSIYLSDACDGHPDKDCLFILNEDTIKKWSSAKLNFYKYGNLILGSADEIPGLEKY